MSKYNPDVTIKTIFAPLIFGSKNNGPAMELFMAFKQGKKI